MKRSPEGKRGALEKRSKTSDSREVGWESVPGGAWRTFGAAPCAFGKIAGFDLDGTLIKSGGTAEAWAFWSPSVKRTLQAYEARGYAIAILSNLADKTDTLALAQARIEAVARALELGSLTAVVSSANDELRKPRTGMWDVVLEQVKDVDADACVFVGDAAGRSGAAAPKGRACKKEADYDLKCALNVGCAFLTPEQCFEGGAKSEPPLFDLDPRALGRGGASAASEPRARPDESERGQEVVVLVGAPGSGKSSACCQRFARHARVNQDTLKTKAKCEKACAQALARGESVVIDNQNKNVADRAAWLAAAREADVPCRAVHLDVPKALCFHLNACRVLNTQHALHRDKRVPDVVIHTFYKHLQQPTTAEGFAEVLTLGLEDFELLGSDRDKRLVTSFVL